MADRARSPADTAVVADLGIVIESGPLLDGGDPTGDLNMWPRFLNIAVGIWLMAAPAVLGYGPPAATNDRVVGPIAASFATIAIWEATRQLRRANWALGGWLLIVPWLLGYGSPAATVNSMVAGVLLIAFASLGGSVKQRFGGGWSSLWTSASQDNDRATGSGPQR